MKLTLIKSDTLEDWYLIERAEHENKHWLERTGPNSAALQYTGRISDACVEGTKEEMLDIANSIREKTGIYFKRCAVDATEDPVEFWSPRNSQTHGQCSREEALALADEIENYFAKAAVTDTAKGA